MLNRNSSTDLARRLSTLLSDAQAADDLALALDDTTAWNVGLELLSARASLQKALDLLSTQPRHTTVVHSPALDAIYTVADELFA